MRHPSTKALFVKDMITHELRDAISRLEVFGAQDTFHGRVRRMSILARFAIALLMAFVFVPHTGLRFMSSRMQTLMQRVGNQKV